jgi:hypothetical protein
MGVCVLAGCGEGSSGDSESPGGDLADGYSVQAALQELPDRPTDGDEPIQVTSGDLAQAAKLGSLPKPTDEKSAAEWARGLTEPPLYFPDATGLGLQRFMTGKMRAVLGFDVRDVATYASLEGTPEQITVMRLIDDADPKEGVATTSDGKVGDVATSGPQDEAFPFVLGVAQRDDRIALARSSEGLKAWKDGSGKTLADRDVLADVAKALDDHEVYAAFLTDKEPQPRPPLTPQAREAAGVSVPEYDAVGVGEGVEDDKPVEYVAYRVDDAGKAKSAIEAAWRGTSLRTKSPIDQLVQVEDVTAEGDVVVVELAARQGSGIAVQMLLNGDLPFLVK